jgi:hypothetical protein
VEDILSGLSDYSPVGVVVLVLVYIYAIRAD